MRRFVCDGDVRNGGALRAIAGARALWDCYFMTGNFNEYWTLETAVFGDPYSRVLEAQPRSCATDGDTSVGPASGDGSTLVYAFVQRRCDYDAEGERWSVAAAGLKRVRGGRAAQVRDVPAPALLDVSGNRVALAPAVVEADGRTNFAPAVDGPVEVRDASTGALLTSVAPRGLARAIALSGATLAVLASSDGQKRIDRYNALSGELVGQTMVPTQVTAIDAAGTRIVYQAGRTIHVLNALSGRARRLLTVRRHPLGLSIEGSRVAWAVNNGRTGRVRALWFSSGRLAGREGVRLPAHVTTPAN